MAASESATVGRPRQTQPDWLYLAPPSDMSAAFAMQSR